MTPLLKSMMNIRIFTSQIRTAYSNLKKECMCRTSTHCIDYIEYRSPENFTDLFGFKNTRSLVLNARENFDGANPPAIHVKVIRTDAWCTKTVDMKSTMTSYLHLHTYSIQYAIQKKLSIRMYTNIYIRIYEPTANIYTCIHTYIHYILVPLRW